MKQLTLMNPQALSEMSKTVIDKRDRYHRERKCKCCGHVVALCSSWSDLIIPDEEFWEIKKKQDEAYSRFGDHHYCRTCAKYGNGPFYIKNLSSTN